MKLLSIIFLFTMFSSLQARELGEDPSNVECTNSIQKSRPHMALVKIDVKDDEIPEVQEEEKKTISK